MHPENLFSLTEKNVFQEIRLILRLNWKHRSMKSELRHTAWMEDRHEESSEAIQTLGWLAGQVSRRMSRLVVTPIHSMSHFRVTWMDQRSFPMTIPFLYTTHYSATSTQIQYSVLLFSSLNNICFGYFDPEDIFIDDKNN